MLPVHQGQINPDNPLAIDYVCKPSLLGDFAQDRFQVDTASNKSNGLRAWEFKFLMDVGPYKTDGSLLNPAADHLPLDRGQEGFNL